MDDPKLRKTPVLVNTVIHTSKDVIINNNNRFDNDECKGYEKRKF